MQQQKPYVTLVSIVPRPIREPVPGLTPGLYSIEAAKTGPKVLVIGEATYDIYMGDGRNLSQVCPPYKVAEGIIGSYVNSQLGLAEDAAPGLFYVNGLLSEDDVKKKHEHELSQAYAKQRRWFENLCKMADDDWMKFHQHKMISDLQRDAAKALSWKADWVVKVANQEAKNCPACGSSLLIATASKCHVCQTIIDPVAYSKFQPASNVTQVVTAPAAK